MVEQLLEMARDEARLQQLLVQFASLLGGFVGQQLAE